MLFSDGAVASMGHNNTNDPLVATEGNSARRRRLLLVGLASIGVVVLVLCRVERGCVRVTEAENRCSAEALPLPAP
jgi:hypothetical protein